MDKIFLVVGDTGRYEDRVEWNVAAYPTREQAELHALNAQAAADAYKASHSDWRDFISIPTGANPFDPEFMMDSTYPSTDYSVVEVPFFA